MPKRIDRTQKPTPSRTKQERTAWKWYDLARAAATTGDPGKARAANSLGQHIGAPLVVAA